VLISIQYIVMAVVGGLGTVWGAVVGAAAITLLVQGLDQLANLPGMPSYAPSVLSYAVYALVLIVVVLFLPNGLLPTIAGRLSRRLGASAGGSGLPPFDPDAQPPGRIRPLS
jgi:branched-chain amino acid transport system permease protein